MKTRRTLALGFVSFLLTASAARAVIEIWDGGGGNNNLSTGLNWADDTAPLSSLANTDLLFVGMVRPNPNVSVALSVASIAFDALTAFSIGGLALDVGEGGIDNRDTNTHEFTNGIDFSGVANTSIHARDGGLRFTGSITPPTGTLTVTGGFDTDLDNFNGSGTISKTGAGEMIWTPNLTQSVDVTVSSGTLRMGTDGSTDVFGSAVTLAINGTSTLSIQESLTLNGATITRASGATISLAAAETLQVQNGGDVTITGAYANTTDSTIVVTGVGSTFSTTTGLQFNGGTAVQVAAGADVSSGSTLNIGTAGDGAVTVDGSGSSLSAVSTMNVGLSGATGSLTFTNGSTGAFVGILVDASGVTGTDGTVEILSGSTVAGAGLSIAPNIAANSGEVRIADAGSSLTIANNGAIGALSSSAGSLLIQTGGTFLSGTGTTTVNATGTIGITGGTYQSRGNLTLNGGTLSRSNTGVFTLDPGTTFTVQAGGSAAFTGGYTNTTASNILVGGAGSQLTTASPMTLGGGSSTSIVGGGTVSSNLSPMFVGSSGNGTVTAGGAGSVLTGGDLFVALNGATGSVTLSDDSTGTFARLRVNDSSTGGTAGFVLVESGATLTGTSLLISRGGAVNEGTVTVTGAGSAITISGAGTAAIGAEFTAPGTLHVNSGGTFNTGTGLTDVRATGTIAIAGGAFNANGNVTLNGGQLTRSATGVFDLDAGRTLLVQAGGDAIFTGPFTHNEGAITVSGAGSTFSTTSTLELIGGTATNVLAGGSLSAGSGAVLVGTNGSGSVAVTGAGASFSGGELRLGSATVTFNSGLGSFAQIRVGQDGASTAALNIQSGSGVTGTGLLVGVDNPGAVTITGAGSTLLLTGSAAAQIGSGTDHGTLNVNSGGTFESSTGFTTVNAIGTVAIGGGIFHARGNLTLDGGQLTRSSTGVLALDAGTTFTVQAGGDATITGAFTNSTASAIAVTGAGSNLSISSTPQFTGGSTLSVGGGGSFSTSAALTFISNATATVDGAGSSFTSGEVLLGLAGGAGSLTFSNSSTGGLGIINVSDSGIAGTSGTLNIQSGATVAGTALELAPNTAAHSGTVTVTGAGSALTLTGSTATNLIGAASLSSGALRVQSAGSVTTTNFGTTIAATGLVEITSGAYISNNSITINGGQLTRDAVGTFTLAAGRTLTVQSGGDALFTGNYTAPSSAAIAVNGAGSTFSTSGILALNGGTTVIVGAGGDLVAGTANIGNAAGGAAVTISGAGSTFNATTVAVGQNGNTGTLTFDNASTGAFTTINVDVSGFAGTNGALTIQGGADVTATSLNVATGAAANTGSVIITGAGSTLTLNGAAIIGAASASSGTVTVQSGATFTTGSSTVNVALTGALNVQSGATLRGAADYTGAGPITLAGAFHPGATSGANRTTSVNFAQDIALQATTSINMEIGGAVPGAGHDQLVFNGAGTPHITWNGALNVATILGFVPQAGHSFDLFNFDPARDAGAFTSINLPALTAGLFWRTDRLYVDGALFIATAPGTYSEWKAHHGAGAWDADDDGDGIENGIEFLLGTDPNVAFASGFYPLVELQPVAPSVTARVTFDIPQFPARDALYSLESSPELATWTVIATKTGGGPWIPIAGVTVTSDPPVAGFVNTIVSETLPAATARRFHRLLGEEP